MRHKLLTLILALALLASMTGCGDTPAPPETPDSTLEDTSSPEPSGQTGGTDEPDAQAVTPEPPAPSEDGADASDSRILVSYFSRVGVTPFPDGVDAVTSASINVRDGELVGNMQYLAEFIVEETGADLHQIITEKEYPIDYRNTTDLASEEQSSGERPALASHVENMEQYDVIFLGYPNWWGTLPQAVVSFLEEYDFEGKTIIPFCSHGGSRLGGGPADIQELCPGAALLDGLAVSGSAVADAREDVAAWLEGLDLDI